VYGQKQSSRAGPAQVKYALVSYISSLSCETSMYGYLKALTFRSASSFGLQWVLAHDGEVVENVNVVAGDEGCNHRLRSLRPT
jgi:hypothetical protein